MQNELVDFSLLIPPLLAGLLVLATHVPLGVRVLARGIVFIDLAVAQAAALGVIAAGLLGWPQHGWAMQAAAAASALIAAGLLLQAEKRWPQQQEALIGTLFVLAASAGMLLLARDPHGSEHLQDLLAGQILWLNFSQLLPAALVTALLLILLHYARGRFEATGFYFLLAVSVTLSVQLVGVYLVFASLIIPALAVRPGQKNGLLKAYFIGAAGYALGLVFSALSDLPAGAIIIWCMAGVAMPMIFMRNKG